MTLTIEAVYAHGVLTPKQPLTLADGTLVHLAVTPVDDDYDPLDAVIGICTEGPDVSLAERHDEIIYGGLVHKELKQP
jgi:predicted DNA-binding antitoxin AbrB/MazE fold protein